MQNQNETPLGICLMPEPAHNGARTVSYPHYLHEILAHAGLCYTRVDVTDLGAYLPKLTVLVTVGDYAEDDALRDQLADWVAAGGQWITIAGVCGLAPIVGVQPEQAAYSAFGGGTSTLGEGYWQAVVDEPLAATPLPLHYFNGFPAQPGTARVLASLLDAHHRQTERVGLSEQQYGKGRILFFAPDIPGTIVRIQHGTGVLRDGVSAPDGTAAQGDCVLKSSDGAVLDWLLDRQPVADVPGLQAFLQPIADIWKDLLLHALFDAIARAGAQLPVLWYYPRNLPALAHLSHDTDLNDPACAERMLEVVQTAGINSTWCVILPGYPPELIERIGHDGHELAMHYDAMSDGLEWGSDQFHRQWEELVTMFNGFQPVTNKNHYLRWEGDSELFAWCVAHGIQLDQSKGASKTGEAGFVFGTCHPFFPVDFRGQFFDVLELSTPTQDFLIFAPPDILKPMLDAALNYHGILHLLFHPSHIMKPGVADALLQSIAAAKEQGLEWWRSDRINAWERARRGVHWQKYVTGDGVATVEVFSPVALEGATFLWPGKSVQVTVAGKAVPTTSVIRWGQPFQAITVDVPANQPITLGASVAEEAVSA